MPVTRSRTSAFFCFSEQSAPELISEDLKHAETEDKDLSLTSQKNEVNVETKSVNQVEEVINSANNSSNNEASNEVTTRAATTETMAAEENNGNTTNLAEEPSEKAENGVSQENHDRNDAKRKSEVGLSETPDSTELTTKKAKVDEETPKVSETEEATPTNPVEASA